MKKIIFGAIVFLFIGIPSAFACVTVFNSQAELDSAKAEYQSSLEDNKLLLTECLASEQKKAANLEHCYTSYNSSISYYQQCLDDSRLTLDTLNNDCKSGGYDIYGTSTKACGCSSGKTKNSDGSYDCKVKMKKNQSISVIFKVSGTSSSSSSSEASSSSFGPYSTVTGSASNITSTSTTLNGTIIPNGNSLSYIFAYRKNSESSSATKYVPFNSYTSIGSTSGDVSVSADISGLSSGTKYIYRLYVWNSKTKKVTSGLVKYFTTSGGSSSSSSFSSSSNNSSRSSLSSSKHTIKVNIKNASTIEGQLEISTPKNGSIGCVIKELNNKDCSLSGITHDDTATIKIENTTGSFSGWSDDNDVCNDNIKTCDIKMDADKTISVTFGS